MVRTAPIALTALLSLPLVQQPEPAVPPRPDPARLKQRLMEGPGPVRVIVFGDSLAAGWGPKDPDTEGYPALFERALKARYPHCELEIIAAGGPGDSSEIGLIRLERDVLLRKPDVVVVQFGGNDQRLGRKPEDLEKDLSQIVETLTGFPTNALCIVAANPFDDAEPGNPFVQVTQRIAREAGVPFADFDQALHDADRDFRGPFCWGGHPGAYSHLIMARGLLEAWDQLLGMDERTSVQIEGYSKLLAAGDLPRLRTSLRHEGNAARELDFDVSPGLLSKRETVTVSPGEQADFAEQVSVPALEPLHRTRQWPLSALARSTEAGTSDIDVKKLAIAPVIIPDTVRGPLEPEALTWRRMSWDCLVKGDYAWEGDEDLSAQFAVARDGARLKVLVEVTDDDFDPADRRQTISEGDSVEVCLDLRPTADQGKPVYSKDVILLQVKPSDDEGVPAMWAPLDDLTPRMVGISAKSRTTETGYFVELSLPMRMLERLGEMDYAGMGFDLHINDSDWGFGRESQMVWAGTENNYLNPSLFGALAPPSDAPPVCRASLR